MKKQLITNVPGHILADIITAWGFHPASLQGEPIGIVRVSEPCTKLGIVQQVGEFRRLIGRLYLDLGQNTVVAHALGSRSLMAVEHIAAETAATFNVTADVSQAGAHPIPLSEGDDGAEKEEGEPQVIPLLPARYDYDSDEATFGPKAFGD